MHRKTIILVAAALAASGPVACSRTTGPAAGGPNPNPTMRLAPVQLKSAAGADLGAAGDRDTTTGFAVDGAMEAVVRFDHAVEIRRVKAHGTGLAVEIPGHDALPLSGSWESAALADPVTATELTVRLVSTDGTARLDELEVWGAGRPRSPRDVQAMAEATRVNARAFEDVRVVAASPGAATLDPAGTRDAGRCLRAKLTAVDARVARRAYLAYEADVPRSFALERSIDGDAVAGGFWLGNVPAPLTLVDELDPERLGTPGELVLCVPPHATGKARVSGVRLLLVSDDGLDPFDRETHLRLSTLVDGDARAFAVAGSVELAFDRPTALDAANVVLGAAPVRLSALELLEETGWSRQGDLELPSDTSVLPVAGRVAQAMRLAFPAAVRDDLPSASVAEVTAEGSGVGERIGAARIILTAPMLRFEGGREVGERFGDRAYVAGWAESPAGPGRVEIGGAEVGVGGAFAVTLDRPAGAVGTWSVEIRARFPDGTEVVRTVEFERDLAAELLEAAAALSLSDDARFGRENRTAWGLVDAEHGGKITLGTDVTFEAPPGAVPKGTSVGITRKGPEEMPPLDAGMVNVTAPAHSAYRFLPKGQKFLKPVRVGIPYDPSLLPDGVLPEEIQTWFYEDKAERWTALPRVELLRTSNRVVSETTHFTFMINAVLVLPDHPGPTSFNPNSIKDLKAADPSTGIDLIPPPEQNNMGTAQTGLRIRLPPARGAHQPELQIAYDSGGGNGWLGVGWDLAVSSVQIDTRFGAPQYETFEPRYLLDGEQLVPTDEEPTCAGGGVGRRYRARVEKSFRRVLRCGSGPTAYWFEVQDKQGNFHLYGKSPLARLSSYSGPAYVGQWFLERVVDTNGNLTEYAYDTDHKAAPTVPHPGEVPVEHREDFRHLYLRSIQYTGRVPGKPRDPFGTPSSGPYHVELVSEQDTRGRHLARPDTITTGRLGFKSVLRRRLKSILVQIDRNGGTDTIREYRLSYERGPFSFGKSRLSKLEVFGAGPAASRKLFHTHTFQYWDPNLVEPFAPPVAWTFTESPDDLSITRSEESGWGTHGYGGIGFTYDKVTGSVGGRIGFNQHSSSTKSSLVDINGDGLPDRVTEAAGGYDVRFNTGTFFPSAPRWLTRALPPGDPAAGERYPVPLPTLGKEEGNGWNSAVQASFAAFSANAGYSHFETKTTELLADADGDGLVDVVQQSGVLLNQHRSTSQKGFAFVPQVTGTSLASTPASTDPDQQRLDDSIRSQLKPSDAVLEWIAPFVGRVDLSGALSFVNRPRPSRIPPERDGVRIQVFLWTGDPAAHAVKLFERVKTLADPSVPMPVGVANLDVWSGWRVYVVLSTLADFPLDRVGPSPLEDVRFSPAISYTHLGWCPSSACRPLTGEEQERIEPNGTATFHFDQALDFRIAGQPQASVAIPANGTLRLETSLVKRRSTDDVRVCVQRFTQKGEVKDLRCEADGEFDNLFDLTIPAGEAGTYPLAGSFAALAGEKLVFRIQTDLPVDPASADWAIAGHMETVCAADGTACDAPPPDIAEAMTFVADAWFPVHNPVYRYSDPDRNVSIPESRPLEPWVASQAGTLKVLVNPPGGFGVGYRQSDALYVAVRTPQSLLVKKRFDEVYPEPYEPIVEEIHVERGERVYFELFSDAWFWAAWAPQVTFVPDVFPFPFQQAVPVNDRFTSIRSGDSKASVRSLFGGGHHLLHYGAWHAPNDEDFDPARLLPSVNASSDQDLYDDFQSNPAVQDATKLGSPLLPRRLGTYFSKAKPGLAARVPAFVSKDGATFIGAGVWHASREGEFVQTGEGQGESTSLRAMFALGPGLRQSSGESTSLSGGVSVGPVGANLSISVGETNQKSDVLDMNGDRVIDVLSGDVGGTSLRFTDVRDPSLPAWTMRDPHVRLRRNDDASASFGLGLSDPWRRLSDDGFVKALLGMFPAPGGGVGVNFSSTDRELADVNGDGLPDVVSRGGNCFNVRLNLGTRFAAQEDCVPVGNWSVSRLDDLIGALSEVMPQSVVTPDRVRRTTSISLNANAGFTLFENYGATVNWDSSIAATAVVLVDVNGDGLPDYVRKSTKDGVFYVRMNRGYGFGEEQQLPVHAWPAGVTKPWLQDTGLAAAVNGILRLVTGSTPSVDSVEAQGTYGEVPTIGFVFSWGVGPLTPLGTPWLHFSVGGDKTFRRVSGFALGMQDMDGDGFADHVLKAEKAPGTDNSAVWVRLNQMSKSNLLRTVKRPLGGSFDLDYVRAGNTVAMPESRWVLSDVVVHDGRADGTPGHDIATSFTYADGRRDRREREFLGFDQTIETRADGSTVARTFKNDDVLVKGVMLTQTVADAAGRTYVKTTYTYSDPIHKLADGTQLCRNATPFFLRPTIEEWCGSFFVSLDAVEHELREGSEVPADKIVSRQSFGYDLQNGNITSFTDLGDAAPANTADDMHATVVYAKDVAASTFYSVGRPEELVVRSHAGDTSFLRKRVGHYDAAGNLDYLRSFVDDAKYVQVDLAWNDDGRLYELYQPEANGRRYWSRYRYDDTGVTRTHVTRIEDAHGYVSTAEYDERFGEATRTVDVNGNVTRRVFDDFGRVLRVYSPYDTTVAAIRVEYAQDGAVPSARTRNLLPSGGTLDTVVFMDGLSRAIQTQKTAQVHGRGVGVAVSGRQRFDAMGRVAEQGITHFVANLSPGFVDVEPAYKTSFSYDTLGRKVETIEPNGGVFRMTYDLGRAAYDPFLRRRSTVVDPLGKTRVLYRRVDERLAAVEEHVGSQTNTTRYVYDPLGELRTVIDAKGNETHVEYDRLGRRTQLRSPDSGTTDFAYDDMGNLVSRQTGNLRAKDEFVTYEYGLNQLIAVHYPNGTDVKYEYGPPGAAENGAGRIVRVFDDAGFETRGYGRLGEVVRQTRTVKPLKPNDSPQTFETRFSFDSFGRMLSITYPDGERLDYGYNAAGLVNRAVGDRPATKHYEAATEVYLDTLTYDEFGKRRFARFGNGAETTWSYEPDMQRLHAVHTVARGRLLQELTYEYDLVGNLKTMTNALGEPTGRRSGAVSYTFDYDDLYRLTTATGTAKARPGVVDQFKATYQLDEIHNLQRLDQEHWITSASDLGTETAYPPHTNHHFAYVYGGAGPHQATQIGDRNIVYDANGNTLRECRDHGDPTCTANADHLRRYFWGDDNEMLAVIDGGGWNVTRFIYDAEGQRVVKLGRGGESITIGQYFALKGRKAATKHVFAGETRIASKLLPPPGWETDWSEGTFPSGPIVQAAALVTSTSENGCDPSDYQPQKCPANPAPDPVIDRRLSDTKVRPETYYYHSDQIGSTTWVTDQNGRVHEHVDYFPYGEVWRDPRSDSDGAPVHRQQFLFTSKEIDEETGLYYFGARYLDPVRARWVSPDPALLSYLPAGSDENLPGLGGVYQPLNLSPFAYAFFNPIRLRDADGRETVGELIQRKGVEAAGRGSSVATFGWAFAEAAWTFFGAEAVSRVSDAIANDKEVHGGDVFWATVDVATLGKGGGAVAAGKKLAPKLAGKATRLLGAAARRLRVVFRSGKGIGWTGEIGEAALKKLGGEAQAFFRTSKGGRFIDQLVDGIAHEAKVGYTTLTKSIRKQIAKDAELLAGKEIRESVWHFYKSPVTGLGGPSEPLRQALKDAGIKIIEH